MRILIFIDDVLSRASGAPLELAAKHLGAGHTVDIVICRGALQACPANGRHNELACRLCRSKLDSALASPALARSNVHEMTFTDEDLALNIGVFSSCKELKAYSVAGKNIGLEAASSVMTVLMDPRPDLEREAKLVNSNLRTAAAVYRWFHRSLPLLKPDRIYLMNGRRSSQMPVIRAAQEFGCDFVTWEIGHDSRKYILVPSTFFHDLDRKKADMVRLWDDATDAKERRLLGEQFFRDRRYGTDKLFPETKFKKFQSAKLLPADFSPEQRNVVVFNSSEFEFAAIEGYDNPVYENQIVGLETITNDPRLHPDIRIWLRVHPHLAGVRNSQTEAISRLDPRRVRVIGSEEPVDTYALMEASEKVITFGSTMSAETAYAGIPSILIGREVFEHGGSCYTPSSHDEVMSLINDPELKALPIEGALMFGHFTIARELDYEHYDPIASSLDGTAVRASWRVRLEARLRWWHPISSARWWLSRAVRRLWARARAKFSMYGEISWVLPVGSLVIDKLGEAFVLSTML